jgi:hypothetical protein
MRDHRALGVQTMSLHASYEFYFDRRKPMDVYTYEHVPNTPLWRVLRNGEFVQEFTSLAAAKAYVEHVSKNSK